MAKRYYWLKLPENFFDDDTAQYIEEQENGSAYLLFYLKLCCKSLRAGGSLFRIVGETFLPYDANALARLTNTDVDTVRCAVDLFCQFGIMTVLDTGEIFINQVAEMTGTETDNARRTRETRARQKLSCDNVTNSCDNVTHDCYNVATMSQRCNTDKELYLDPDLDPDLNPEADVDGPKSKKTQKRFEKPAPEEIRAYCEEKGLTIDPEMFYDYYEANGWKVGKNPMKSWKATLRNWSRREVKDFAAKKGAYIDLLSDDDGIGEFLNMVEAEATEIYEQDGDNSDT